MDPHLLGARIAANKEARDAWNMGYRRAYDTFVWLQEAFRLAGLSAAQSDAILNADIIRTIDAAVHQRRGHRANPLLSSQNTAKAERAVRSAAAARFGRGKANPFYEHGQWWVSVWDDSEGEEHNYAVVDTNYGLAFEAL